MMSVLLFPLMDDSSSDNIKSSLCFSDKVPILMFFKANIFLFQMFVIMSIGVTFIFIDRLRMNISKSFCT